MHPTSAKKRIFLPLWRALPILAALTLLAAAIAPCAGAYSKNDLQILEVPVEHRNHYSIAEVDDCTLIAVYCVEENIPFLFTISKEKSRAAATTLHMVVEKLGLRNKGKEYTFLNKTSAAFVPNDLSNYSVLKVTPNYGSETISRPTEYALRLICSKYSQKQNLQFVGWRGTAVCFRNTYTISEELLKSYSNNFRSSTEKKYTVTLEITLDLATPKLNYLSAKLIKGNPPPATLCQLFSSFFYRILASDAFLSGADSKKSALCKRFNCQNILYLKEPFAIVSRGRQYRIGNTDMLEETAHMEIEDTPDFPPLKNQPDQPSKDTPPANAQKQDTPAKPEATEQPKPTAPETSEPAPHSLTPSEALKMYLETLQKI